MTTLTRQSMSERSRLTPRCAPNPKQLLAPHTQSLRLKSESEFRPDWLRFNLLHGEWHNGIPSDTCTQSWSALNAANRLPAGTSFSLSLDSRHRAMPFHKYQRTNTNHSRDLSFIGARTMAESLEGCTTLIMVGIGIIHYVDFFAYEFPANAVHIRLQHADHAKYQNPYIQCSVQKGKEIGVQDVQRPIGVPFLNNTRNVDLACT